MKTRSGEYVNRHSYKNKFARLFWLLSYTLFFRPTPWFMNRWRIGLLRLFGAKINAAKIHPSVSIWAPWKLEIGEHVCIDRQVKFYNVFGLVIGNRVVISQGAFLCSGSHDYEDAFFPLVGEKVTVSDDVWLAAESFVGPGVLIGTGSVVGARSVLMKDVPEWSVVAGNPAIVVKQRIIKND